MLARAKTPLLVGVLGDPYFEGLGGNRYHRLNGGRTEAVLL